MARKSNDEIITTISEAVGIYIYIILYNTSSSNCTGSSTSFTSDTALDLLEDDDWTEETSEGEMVIKSKISKKGRKLWLCTAKVKVAPEVLEEKLMDIDNLTSWNTTVTESRVLKNLRKDVFISYQVTAEGAGGVVSARDFVFGAKTVRQEDRFIIGGLSVESEEAPAGGRVRAIHGPSCQVIAVVPGDPHSSHYTWLMDCDYRGMMPSSILNVAMPIAQTKMVNSINGLSVGIKY